MNMEIRRALPEDAEVLTEIAIAAKGHWGYPARWMQAWKGELTFDAAYLERYESWTALVENRPAGFYTLLWKEDHAWLENLWVRPAQMGRGIGSALFQHARQLSKERGYPVLRFESDPNAVGFYRKMGAHQIGERHSEVEGQARLLPVMELEL
ncbi:MAG TPA: GNAT family N-acetyltransferase [Anaerolineales bacterium]|nr:GNAT family N-acetyltransferase [Anaerolineales bacterium]